MRVVTVSFVGSIIIHDTFKTIVSFIWLVTFFQYDSFYFYDTFLFHDSLYIDGTFSRSDSFIWLGTLKNTNSFCYFCFRSLIIPATTLIYGLIHLTWCCLNRWLTHCACDFRSVWFIQLTCYFLLALIHSRSLLQSKNVIHLAVMFLSCTVIHSFSMLLSVYLIHSKFLLLY